MKIIQKRLDMYQEFSRQIQELIRNLRGNSKLSAVEQTERIIQRTIRIAAIYPVKQDAPEMADFLQNILEIDFFAQKLQVPQLTKMLKIVLGLQNPSENRICHDYLAVDDFDTILPLVLSSISWYFWEKVSDDLATVENERGTTFPLAQTLTDYNNLSVAVIDAQISAEDAIEKIKAMPEFNLTETDVSKILDATFGRQDILGTIVRSFFKSRYAEGEDLTRGSQLFIADPNKAFSIANIRSLSLAMQALKHSASLLPKALDWLYQGALDGAKKRYTSMNAILVYPAMPIEEAIHLGWQSILLPYSFYSIIQFFAATQVAVRELMLVESIAGTVAEIVKHSSIVGRLGNDAITSIVYFDEVQSLFTELMGENSAIGKFPREIMAQSNEHTIRMLNKDALEMEYSTILSSGMYDYMTAKELWMQLIKNHQVIHESFFKSEIAFAAGLHELIEQSLAYRNETELESKASYEAATLISSSLLHFMLWMLDNLYSSGNDFDHMETYSGLPSWLKLVKGLASVLFGKI